MAESTLPDPGIRVTFNPACDPSSAAPDFSVELARRVHAFHADMPEYEPTALHALAGLAADLGVGAIWLKDESTRFGLKAFKGLGVSYALSQLDGGDRPMTLVTATDGNHGRAVAWAAQRAGHSAIVYVPAGASEARAAAIEGLGAEVRRGRGTYDEACDEAADAARRNGWVLLQDTARPGYEQIPRWIMQGYLTLIHEAADQLEGVRPTHLFLQCGVGSFAGAVAAYASHRWSPAPTVVLVEPAVAACGTAAFASRSDEPPLLAGDTHSFMACLSCGQLSTIGWQVLRRHAHAIAAVADEVAREGMRRLARPFGSDPAVVAGESGAATTGALIRLCGQSPDVRETVGLDADSRVLLVSTEGDTDPAVYAATVGSSP